MKTDDGKPQKFEFDKDEYEWIETAGIENLKGRRNTADILAKEAATTLTVLLAGAGGALAYAIKLFDEAANAGTFAAALATVWLTFLSMVLVWRCLKITKIPAVYNQPGELLERHMQGWTFEEWRLAELHNIEARITDAVKRNDEMARRLNLVRELATLTPILAGLGALLFNLAA